MLNNVTLMGRLTDDPVLLHTHTSRKPVTNISIAVNRRFTKDKEIVTDFFNIVAWNTTAEFLVKNFTKGQPICVQGRLQQRSWVDELTKKTRYTVEVIAEAVHFAGFKKEEAQNAMSGFDPFAAEAS